MDHNATLHAIQLAIAPVFFLTAIAGLIGALATRLARIVDRARDIEERLAAKTIVDEDGAYRELERARLRGRIVNLAIALLTISGALICTTVMTLFLGETGSPRSEALIPWSFLGGLVTFMLALLCFLVETLLATEVLRFKRKQ